MKFPYQEYPREPSEAFPDSRTRLSPIIPISVTTPKKSVMIDALVDSGADHCIFPGMLGVALGIDVNKGPKQLISGLGGRVIEARFHSIQLKLGRHLVGVCAGFSFDTIGVTGLLGQKGFFDNFKVIFDRSSQFIIVKRHSVFQKLLSSLEF